MSVTIPGEPNGMTEAESAKADFARYGYMLSKDRKGYRHETLIIQMALKDISI